MGASLCASPLRSFNAVHIDEDLTAGFHGYHENELFYNCKFKNVRDLVLVNCVLDKSEFLTDKLDDALGFTLTLGDCNSFQDVKFSDFMLELYLVMAIKTNSNLDIRKKLIALLGEDKLKGYLRQFSTLER